MPHRPSRAGRRTRRRRPLVVTGLAALLALPGLALAPAASAHDRLVSSSPHDGASVASARKVTLTYAEKLIDTGYDVVVTGPDGAVDGELELDGVTLTDRFTDPLPAGSYRVIWRAVSADGHPISGRLRFGVRPDSAAPATSATSSGAPSPQGALPTASPAAPSPQGALPTASPGAPSPQGALPDGSDDGWGTALVAVLVVLGAAAAGLIVLAKRRGGGTS